MHNILSWQLIWRTMELSDYPSSRLTIATHSYYNGGLCQLNRSYGCKPHMSSITECEIPVNALKFGPVSGSFSYYFYGYSRSETPSSKIITPPELVTFKKRKYQPNLTLIVINENKLIIPKFKRTLCQKLI